MQPRLWILKGNVLPKCMAFYTSAQCSQVLDFIWTQNTTRINLGIPFPQTNQTPSRQDDYWDNPGGDGVLWMIETMH